MICGMTNAVGFARPSLNSLRHDRASRRVGCKCTVLARPPAHQLSRSQCAAQLRHLHVDLAEAMVTGHRGSVRLASRMGVWGANGTAEKWWRALALGQLDKLLHFRGDIMLDSMSL
jgi:hypothetical protein